MPTLKAPKGTRDIFGPEAALFSQLENHSRRVFELFQFKEVRIPIFESVDLFKRSMGATSDVVEKEMFGFTDRGDRQLALRPEGTAGVVRFFLEQNLLAQGPVHRFFYLGPMFRAERPQAGRYRQFWQIGAEHFGDAEAAADANMVIMVARIFEEFELTQYSVQVNSLGCSQCRSAYRKELIKFLKGYESTLTEESLRRLKTNPLRVLDSKIDGPKLKDPPLMTQYLCNECRDHYQKFLQLIKGKKFKVEENPRLVRGLDYYSKSVFEFVSPHLGAQNALAAGGRYNDLVAHLGGPATPATGFALGVDRVVLAKKEGLNGKLSPGGPPAGAVIVPMLEAAVSQAFELGEELRGMGISVPPIPSPKKKLKNHLSAAVDAGAKWAILIGEDELKSGTVSIKNLEQRRQESVKRSEIKKYLGSP